MVSRRAFTVPADLAGVRLDVAVTRLAPDLSRTRVQALLEKGFVRVGGEPARPSVRLRGGEVLEVEVPPPEPSTLLAQDLPLRVLHEDRDLLVLDKAAGMVVHPARGSPHSTVLNALLFRLAGADRLATSKGEDVSRLGLVHRLDKDTSGCLVVAKTEAALVALQAQWKGRSVEKSYLALCHGALAPEGRLETFYGRHPGDRKRFTSKLKSGRRALTEWVVEEAFGERATLARVALHTGRTHQIRVHLAESGKGHPILGDATYGGTRREGRLQAGDPVREAAAAIGRQALHAARLAFEHPRTGRRLVFEAPLPPDFESGLAILRAPGTTSGTTPGAGHRAPARSSGR